MQKYLYLLLSAIPFWEIMFMPWINEFRPLNDHLADPNTVGVFEYKFKTRPIHQDDVVDGDLNHY